jgi:hypothetical protein
MKPVASVRHFSMSCGARSASTRGIAGITSTTEKK